MESPGKRLCSGHNPPRSAFSELEIFIMVSTHKQVARPSTGGPKHFISPIFILAPLVLLSVPLGLPNNISQPLAILMTAPLIWKCIPSAKNALFIFLIIGTISISFLQINLNPSREYSFYQAFRSFTPFLFLTLISVSYKDIVKSIEAYISRNPVFWEKTIRNLIYAFCAFCTIQTLSYFLGLPMANMLSGSAGERVMIFQTTSCILLLYYGVVSNNYFVIITMLTVVLGSGSKSIFFAAVLVFGVAMFYRFKAINFIKGLMACLALAGVVHFSEPLVVERLMQFFEGTGGANDEAFTDKTREYEIDEAKQTLGESHVNLLFGAGFIMQLSDGVPTNDPAWAENSKYDIENAYWGVLGKLGVVFSLAFVTLLVLNLPRTNIMLVFGLIQVVMATKTSYQIFAYFDGVMMLLWSIIIFIVMKIDRYKELRVRHAPQHQPTFRRKPREA